MKFKKKKVAGNDVLVGMIIKSTDTEVNSTALSKDNKFKDSSVKSRITEDGHVDLVMVSEN